MDIKKYTPIGHTILSLALLASTGYLLLANQNQKDTINMLLEERNYFLLESASSSRALNEGQESASSSIASLNELIASAEEEIERLERSLKREKNRNEEFEEQIEAISGTVGVLDKLSKTDRELLQKYSRTYFLNENFVPMKLSQLDSSYIMPGRKDQYFHGDAIDYLTEMLDDAARDGHDLKVISAFRSFDEQQALKGQFTQVYGSGANAFSADQGFSEHQLGTAVDITDTGTGGTFQSFANTPAYKWLQDNAHKYGFILSYPEGNNFYIFEPWHWRFVGRELASDLKDENAKFYDWDQRRIDEYLVKIFD
jgi:zinc D-Ala-D-Ala carboxypeptidase